MEVYTHSISVTVILITLCNAVYGLHVLPIPSPLVTTEPTISTGSFLVAPQHFTTVIADKDSTATMERTDSIITQSSQVAMATGVENVTKMGKAEGEEEEREEEIEEKEVSGFTDTVHEVKVRRVNVTIKPDLHIEETAIEGDYDDNEDSSKNDNVLDDDDLQNDVANVDDEDGYHGEVLDDYHHPLLEARRRPIFAGIFGSHQVKPLVKEWAFVKPSNDSKQESPTHTVQVLPPGGGAHYTPTSVHMQITPTAADYMKVTPTVGIGESTLSSDGQVKVGHGQQHQQLYATPLQAPKSREQEEAERLADNITLTAAVDEVNGVSKVATNTRWTLIKQLTRVQFSWVDIIIAVSCSVAILLVLINMGVFMQYCVHRRKRDNRYAPPPSPPPPSTFCIRMDSLRVRTCNDKKKLNFGRKLCKKLQMAAPILNRSKDTEISTLTGTNSVGTQYENMEAMIASFISNDLIVELNDRDSACTSVSEGFTFSRDYGTPQPIEDGGTEL